jgi:hypothetical protein
MADTDLINDELERVYRLYGERTRAFRRSLYVLIVAGLALFALIVVPFLTFRDQLAAVQAVEAELAVELEETRDAIDQTEAGVEQLRQLQQSFERYYAEVTELETLEAMQREAAAHAEALAALRADFAGWEDPGMAAWVRGEVRQPPPEIIATNRRLWGLARDACYWDSGMARLTCRLCEGLTRENERVRHRIGRLPGVDDAVRRTVVQDLDSLVERACGWLTRGEPHWDSETTLASRADSGLDIGLLRGWFNADLFAYRDRLVAFERTLSQSLVQRALQAERLERSRTEVGEHLAVLETQLNRIASFDRVGTPVGDLPVGLGQIVLLFPAVLAFGFLVVGNGYARSAEIQRAFVRLCRKRDAAGEVMDAEHLAAIAPLWLDPHEPLGARLAKWAILLTPLALTLANLLMIYRTDALTDQLPADAAIPPVAYRLLYAASLALFAGTLWYIWRSGRAGAAASEPAAGAPESNETGGA